MATTPPAGPATPERATQPRPMPETPPLGAGRTATVAKRLLFPPVPPTPGMALRCGKVEQKGPAFPGTILPVETATEPLEIEDAPEGFHARLIYNDNGIHRNIMKQPLGSKSCWAYSFAMLLTDVLRSGKEVTFDDKFHRWFYSAQLLTAERVHEEAKRLGVDLSLTSIPKDTPLETLREQLQASGFPVLATIEHPTFSGHTIVIDTITDTDTTIRDPFSGRAFVIPNAKMSVFFQGDDDESVVGAEEKCLSIIPPQQQAEG
ncbi:MAG: papain-like cysteine protease family protein [Simkaniaceae bacterium]|nr:papain-like cysteine protease family protein [Candidatus Sacchlamyda saccharinae]